MNGAVISQVQLRGENPSAMNLYVTPYKRQIKELIPKNELSIFNLIFSQSANLIKLERAGMD